jgi:hypothetical protein
MFQQSNFYTSPILANLPPQMIAKSEKTEEWKKRNMDALDAVGRQQFQMNMRLLENYEMIKGKFIPTHYTDGDEGYTDMIGQLHKEFNLPSYLRHYDIMAQVINTLSGEWQQRPDLFVVKDESEHASNEFNRTQTDHLQKYVISKIQAEVSKKLIDAGIDENGASKLPPDQQQQYQQMVDQAKQQMTPPEIQQYMTTEWKMASEMWAEHQLRLDRKRFKQDELEKREFEDMLVADRCFRHYYLTPMGHKQETWNPVHTFFQKSPDVEYIEEGDYVGRVFYLTVPAIIDRYGHKMKKSEIEALQEYSKKTDQKWNYAAGTEYVFNDYMVPFRDYPTYDILKQTGQAQGLDGMPPYASGMGIPQLDSNSFASLYNGKFYNEARGFFLVTEAYWKSQEKLGKVTYIDPDTGLEAKIYVDEDVVIPKNFKQIDSAFFGDSDEVNTVVWTYVNRVWQGVKISVKNHGGMSEDIYLDVKPCDFQFKGDHNPYEAKLPVCGQVFSPRNSESMSLVDFMKPHQIGYNVAMNQAYMEMQKDAGKFIVMDQAMFADVKDWGGSSSYEKFMLIAKELGVTVVNTKPTDGSTGAASGHYPKEVDLDASARILSRLKIAEAFEAFALKQVGFNEYRLGQQAGTTTATTTQQGEARSFAQTESYFTNFSNYLRRCQKMDLDIAQYTQVNNQDITVSYIKSDMSRSVVKLQGTDLLFSELNLYVWNSQEEVRQLNMLRQLAMSNNTLEASFTDLADVITSNSPAEIKLKLKMAQKRTDDMKNRQYELERQKVETDQQLAEKKLEIQHMEFEEEWGQGGTRERIAYMTTFNRQPDNEADKDGNGVPDLLEYDKLNQKAEADEAKNKAQTDKNQIEREKMQQQREIELGKLSVAKAKIDADLQIQREELESVKILKGKEIKARNKKKTP